MTEARLAARRQARAEARENRLRDSENKFTKDSDGGERLTDFLGNSLRNTTGTSGCKTATRENRAPSSYTSSRRSSSQDSLDVPFDNYREMKHQIQELEDKLRTVTEQNAQLENEKQSYAYQVDGYKDDIEELEENFIRLQKELKEKSRNFDNLNREYRKAQEELLYTTECLRQRDTLIEDHGLVLIGQNTSSDDQPHSHMNGDIIDKRTECSEESGSESGNVPSAKTPGALSLISHEAADLLAGIEGDSLEKKLKTLIKDREEMKFEIYQLKNDLEDEKQRNARFEELNCASINGSDSQLLDAQREANKLLSDYKYKLRKAEQEINTLQGSVSRLETQVARFKISADEAEKLEDELKAEKRKLQRDLREALAKIEELENANVHLQKRIDKLKSNRPVLISNT